MTLDRIHNKIVFECNGCEEILTTGTSDFVEARQFLHDERWRTAKISQEWHHFCPDCVKAKGWD